MKGFGAGAGAGVDVSFGATVAVGVLSAGAVVSFRSENLSKDDGAFSKVGCGACFGADGMVTGAGAMGEIVGSDAGADVVISSAIGARISSTFVVSPEIGL